MNSSARLKAFAVRKHKTVYAWQSRCE